MSEHESDIFDTPTLSELIESAHNAEIDGEARWLEERRAARIDPLTGIYNRRWLEEALGTLTVREPGNFSLAFIDLDDLKRINDKQGHDAGNQLLIKAATTLQRSLVGMQTEDQSVRGELVHAAVRLAGDEYVLLLSGVNNQEQLGPLLQKALDALRDEGIGASIGGRPHEPGETGMQLLASVDELMYEHKLQRKQEKFDALPRRKQIAAHIGMRLLRYAGMSPTRTP